MCGKNIFQLLNNVLSVCQNNLKSTKHIKKKKSLKVFVLTAKQTTETLAKTPTDCLTWAKEVILQISFEAPKG